MFELNVWQFDKLKHYDMKLKTTLSDLSFILN